MAFPSPRVTWSQHLLGLCSTWDTMDAPRLRLNRQPAMQPSIFDTLSHDAESLNSSPPSTPKATPKQKLSGLPYMGHLDDSVQGDEERRPADMLRSLLGRSRTSGPNHPMTPVDSDSDFEGPSPPLSRSIASQSVKDLFQRAIREPGDTPDKRQRRNSFDSGSSVRMGPTIRRSASDEEDSGGGALRSSQATTFDILRGKLDLPSSVISESITSSIPKRLPQGQDLHDLIQAAEEMDLSFPERASQRSDAEESDATKDWTTKRPSRIPRSTPDFKFPDTSRTRTNSNPGRYTPSSPTTQNRYSASNSPTAPSRLPLARPGSTTSHSSLPRPRTVSSSSTASSHSEEGPEDLHERERNWNSPRPRWDSHSSQESVKAKEREERNRETEKWVRPRTQSNNAIPVRASPTATKKPPTSPSPSPRAAYPRSNSVTSRTGATKSVTPLTERMAPFTLGGSPSPSRDKGHKRATAQLANANGPVPPTLPSDEEGSVFSNAPSTEPATSTPVTGNGRTLPPAPDSPVSDVPLPAGPPSPPSRALDSERLSKAMASSTSRPQPPPSPPRSRSPSVRDSRTPSPPSPQLYDRGRDLMSTPPRAGKARQVFDTPSPPPTLPRLPDPPTDDDTADQIRSAGLGHRREAAMASVMASVMEPKTPRPPGGWATPGQTPRYVDDVTPDNMMSMTTMGGVTPAPPGGWMATPGSAKRKGILKVRFDEQAAAAAAAAAAAGDSTEVKLDDIEEEEEKPKRSNVRLVDEFGRERVFGDDGREVPLGEPGSPTRPHMKRRDVGSPPRKPTFRVVDALGREMDEASMRLAAGVNGDASAGSPVVDDLINGINGTIKEENEESDLDEDNVPKSLAAKLRKITGDLYHDLDLELDKPDAFPMTREGKLRGDELVDLARSSRTSRIERMKLSKKLELVKATDEGVYKTMKSLRGLVKSSPMSLFRQAREAQGLTKGLIWAMILIQFLFVGLMYSYAHDLARRFFITAHYDPFYPALYDSKNRQFVNNNFNGAIPSSLPHSWNVFAVPESTRRVGVWGVLNSVGEQALQLVTGDRKWSASVGAGRVGGRTWPPS